MFELLSPADIEALPELEYLIQGMLPFPSLGVLVGSPTAGKSFMALSMALAVASGLEWLGRKTIQRPVLYVAAEGVLGMKLRLQAYRERFGLDDTNVRFIAEPFDVRNESEVRAVLDAIAAAKFQPNLIIIDTLARVAVGADENSAKDMGQVVDGLERMKRETGAALLVVHHTRKNDLVERGSSALRGAADVMISCEKAEGSDGTLGANLKCEKMKDDEPFKDIGVALEKVELSNGKSSLVVAGTQTIHKASTEHGKKILEILQNKFDQNGASHKELKEAFVSSGAGQDSTFARALRELRGSDRMIVDKVDGKARYIAVPEDIVGEAGRKRIRELFAEVRNQQ
ncbi:MAG: helicase RepA family protein [Roseobacter sp.]